MEKRIVVLDRGVDKKTILSTSCCAKGGGPSRL